jgi:FtsP/CotA-like multicopper oxidase with cupredoxin domain
MADSRRLRGPGLVASAFAAIVFLAAGAAQAAVKEYWVAAVPVTWNVVPNERNAIEHETFTPDQTTLRTVVYKAFTANWGKPLPDIPWISGDNDGIPGPTIRARVGDTILVHFRNDDTEFKRPHSMHFHGVRYAFGSDGAFIPGFSTRGANVKPGQTFTYRLKAIPGSAGVWPYHDHSPSMGDSIAGGLYGALSILAPGQKPPDKEFVVFFESMLGFMTVNGRAFVGNTPVFHARVGDVVQWDVLALGDEHHTFHLHGHRWLDPDGTSIDTKTIGPAESFSFRITEDVPGTWLYHCHVEGHMMRGMIGIYRVRGRPPQDGGATAGRVVRR